MRFSPPQAKKLISNIEDTKFADLVEGGYVTGARYEELTGAKVSHFDRNGRTLTVGERELLKGLLLLCDFRHVADEIAGASAYTDMTRIGGDFRQAFGLAFLTLPSSRLPSPQARPCFGGISAVERHYSAFRKDKASPLEFIHSRGHLPDKHSPIMTRLR